MPHKEWYCTAEKQNLTLLLLSLSLRWGGPGRPGSQPPLPAPAGPPLPEPLNVAPSLSFVKETLYG